MIGPMSVGERMLSQWNDFDQMTRRWANPFCQRAGGQTNEKAVTFLATLFKIISVAVVSFAAYLMWHNPIISITYFTAGCLVHLQPETLEIIMSRTRAFLHDSIVSIQLHEHWLKRVVMAAAAASACTYALTTLIPPMALASFIGFQLRGWIVPRNVHRVLSRDAQIPGTPLLVIR